MAKEVFDPIGFQDDVEVLTGKYKGYVGYVVDMGLGMVTVRLQTGNGWHTFNYKHKNVKKL